MEDSRNKKRNNNNARKKTRSQPELDITINALSPFVSIMYFGSLGMGDRMLIMYAVAGRSGPCILLM